MLPVRLNRGSDTRVRAQRVRPHASLVVESKTIGTAVTYSLETENVSRSGMLLAWQQNRKIPFLVNTIIEMRIDPSGSTLGTPVSCLGKVVRREATAPTDAETTRFGIQIIQMEGQEQSKWDQCVDVMERLGTSVATPTPAVA